MIPFARAMFYLTMFSLLAGSGLWIFLSIFGLNFNSTMTQFLIAVAVLALTILFLSLEP